MKDNKEVQKEQQAPAETTQDEQVPETTQDEEKECVVVNTQKGLRLRAGPAVSYNILKVLPNKTAAEVLTLPGGAEVPGWALISADGQVGWVMAQYLSAAE